MDSRGMTMMCEDGVWCVWCVCGVWNMEPEPSQAPGLGTNLVLLLLHVKEFVFSNLVQMYLT